MLCHSAVPETSMGWEGRWGAGWQGIRRDKHIASLAWSSLETRSHLLGHKFHLPEKKSQPPHPQAWSGPLPRVTSSEGKEGPKEVFAVQKGSQDNHEQGSPPFIECLTSQEMEGDLLNPKGPGRLEILETRGPGSNPSSEAGRTKRKNLGISILSHMY